MHRQGRQNFQYGYNAFKGIETYTDMTYQASRRTLWLTTSLNNLISLTFTQEGNVKSWAKHEIAGPNADVWGLTVVPNEDVTFDFLYLIVQKEIGGVSKYFLESMSSDWDGDTLSKRKSTYVNPKFEQIPRYLDGWIAGSLLAGTTSIVGLNAYEGEEVTVVRNYNEDYGNYTISSGAIIIPAVPEDSDIMVGFKYTATLKTNKIDAGRNFETAKASNMNIDQVSVQVYKTFDLTIDSETDGVASKYSSAIKIDSTNAVTGQYRIDLHGSPGIEFKTRFRSTQPFPCTILSAVFRGVTND